MWQDKEINSLCMQKSFRGLPNIKQAEVACVCFGSNPSEIKIIIPGNVVQGKVTEELLANIMHEL